MIVIFSRQNDFTTSCRISVPGKTIGSRLGLFCYIGKFIAQVLALTVKD